VKNGVGGTFSAYGGEERRIQGFVGKPEEKRQLGRPRLRWEYNINRMFRKWDVGIWTESSWLRIGTSGGRL